MPHTQYPGRPLSAKGLTDKQKEYIESRYQTLSVAQMSANGHIRAKLIYDFLNEKGWQTPGKLKKQREPASTEFFRWNDFDNDAIFGKH